MPLGITMDDKNHCDFSYIIKVSDIFPFDIDSNKK